MVKKSASNSRPEKPGKLASLKQRHVHVYLPNVLMVEEWKAAADKEKISLSRFIVETMEEALRNDGVGPRHSKRDLINRNKYLEQEIAKLTEDFKLKSRAYESLERENQNLRLQVFQEPGMSGLKKLDKDLIDLFRAKKSMSYEDILPELGIKPTDMDLVKSLQNELQLMLQFGLIKPDYKGWRWVK